ncbi:MULTISPECIES: sporulation-specific diadenylate cyclase CdaS [Cytobacillus]|uniref:DAC domain-containing protein n=1 Tax=Cytobacillus kochii TaxID=859143 RepID=A0A248TMG1_9BACI|nr:sporulation-specific diadenylate cyclase CdaS [Cytobacillus kochii]ASV69428.1 hypothetical protein CKF48_20180 [Cytobacillus kochii]MDQ0184182.1 DNA integrity scanning protein DisA with diadenylate cyclase activity [Cytobacillus kochii]MED1604488.1 sporulation-specific diadenylate cyclase CdaS [Cytobacillus kochii]
MQYGLEDYQSTLEQYIKDIEAQLSHLSNINIGVDCCILTEFEQLQQIVSDAHNLTATYYLQHYLSPFTNHFSSISLAGQTLSNKGHGGLIIIEREVDVTPFIHNGIQIDARVSQALIETIFYPGGPVHDGGTLIRGDIIISAGNILPLTNMEVDGRVLGTRHRAALGLSELTDAVILVVSEESGRISFAYKGELFVVRP